MLGRAYSLVLNMPYFAQISLRDDLYKPLLEYSESHNCTKQEVIRIALRLLFDEQEAHKKLVDSQVVETGGGA